MHVCKTVAIALAEALLVRIVLYTRVQNCLMDERKALLELSGVRNAPRSLTGQSRGTAGKSWSTPRESADWRYDSSGRSRSTLLEYFR